MAGSRPSERTEAYTIIIVDIHNIACCSDNYCAVWMYSSIYNKQSRQLISELLTVKAQQFFSNKSIIIFVEDTNIVLFGKMSRAETRNKTNEEIFVYFDGGHIL